MSLTTAAVILAAYAPNEVILADAPSSEDALRISDKEKVVADKETENNRHSEDIHNVIETSKDTEEKDSSYWGKEVVSRKSEIDKKTSNENKYQKTPINPKGDDVDSFVNKDEKS